MSLLLRYLCEANAALDYHTLNQTPSQVGASNQPLTMADISAAYTNIDTALPTYINGSSGPPQPFDILG